MNKKLTASALALALLFGGAAACSSDDSGGGGDDLASTLKDAAADEGEEITDTQAECAADLLVAVLGEEEAQAAAEKGSAGIEEAMTGLTETMTGTGDVEEATRIIESLGGLSDECLTEMGLSREQIDEMSALTEGLEGGDTGSESESEGG